MAAAPTVTFLLPLLLIINLLIPATSFPPSSPGFPFDSNPWSLFQNLTGCNPGDRNPILPDLKSYLQRFGYLPPPPNNFSDVFDANLTGALLSYQRNLGLPATGFLDPSTLNLLSQPRCGVPDVVAENSTATPGRRLYAYFPGSPSWPADKQTLTYAITVRNLKRGERVRERSRIEEGRRKKGTGRDRSREEENNSSLA